MLGCSYYLLQSSFFTTYFKRVTGIEPATSAWEAGILPLNYTRNTKTVYASFIPSSSFFILYASGMFCSKIKLINQLLEKML
ncbi:hypothetical protein CU035_2300 [Enterococcus faecium]|nr:hypothetical protein EfmE1679_0839 [Enterococcus faecium E1679]EFF35423.1 hypothetical protein EfmE1162_0785 [Enterococcus faecium E1162]MBK4794101.1 hypothetical protein [Enterococcus faecium]MBK4816984.1 hypothetical protein [Enterococcus faecium]